MFKLTSCSIGFTMALGASSGAFAADPPPHPYPSKDDIIRALTAPVGSPSRSRGFAVHPYGYDNRSTKTGAPAALKMNDAPMKTAHGAISEEFLFSRNSAEIQPLSRDALNQIAAELSAPQLKDAKIQVEGHADSTGSAEHNLALSQARAEAVRAYLVKEAGIPQERLSAIGKGQNEPIDPANPLSPENRRVILVNLPN